MSVIPDNVRKVTESPIAVEKGDVLVYNIPYTSAVTVHTGAWMKIFKNHSTDVSSTMLSGSLQANLNVLTLKTIDFTSASGGITYTAKWCITVNGLVVVYGCDFNVASEKY